MINCAPLPPLPPSTAQRRLIVTRYLSRDGPAARAFSIGMRFPEYSITFAPRGIAAAAKRPKPSSPEHSMRNGTCANFCWIRGIRVSAFALDEILTSRAMSCNFRKGGVFVTGDVVPLPRPPEAFVRAALARLFNRTRNRFFKQTASACSRTPVQSRSSDIFQIYGRDPFSGSAT